MTLDPLPGKGTLIVTCGSAVRGDDGVGGRVADLVEHAGLPGVDVLRVHQLTPELADAVAGARRIVIVDAAAGKRSSFRRVKARGGAALTHHLTAETLVGLVERLYGVSPNVFLLAVPGTSFALSERLSPPATRAARRAAHRLIRFLEPDHRAVSVRAGTEDRRPPDAERRIRGRRI